MRLTRGQLAAFVAPCLPGAAIGLPVVVLLPAYYTATLGLDIGIVGLIFAIVRVADVPFDPVIGLLIDRSRSRFGRFRPWLGAGALLLALGVAAVFFAKPGISAFAAFAGLLLMYLGYSLAVVSHTSWGAVLSDEYHERSRIFGWWQAANIVGMIGILAVPPLATMAMGADRAGAIHAIGWTIIGALALAVPLAIAVLPERPARTPAGEGHGMAALRGALALPLLRRLLAVDLLSNLGPGIAGALLLFYFEAARGYSTAEASLLLLPYFLSGLAAAPFWLWLARRTSKHRALLWSLGTYMLFQFATILLPSGNLPLAALGMALAGLPYAAPTFLLRAMLADLSDSATLASGGEQTGLFYALLTAVQKLGYAVPVGLAFPLLGLIGFIPALGTGNAPAALMGLEFLFVVPPVLLAGAAALLVRRWPIDAEAQERTAAQLSLKPL